MRRTLAAIRDEQQPRSAAHIAMLTGLSQGSTLHQLEQLEADGIVHSSVDEASVVRWSLVPIEWTEREPDTAEIMLLHSSYFQPL